MEIVTVSSSQAGGCHLSLSTQVLNAATGPCMLCGGIVTELGTRGCWHSANMIPTVGY